MNSVFCSFVSCLPRTPEGQLSRDCTATHTNMQMSVEGRVKEKEASSSTALAWHGSGRGGVGCRETPVLGLTQGCAVWVTTFLLSRSCPRTRSLRADFAFAAGRAKTELGTSRADRGQGQCPQAQSQHPGWRAVEFGVGHNCFHVAFSGENGLQLDVRCMSPTGPGSPQWRRLPQ